MLSSATSLVSHLTLQPNVPIWTAAVLIVLKKLEARHQVKLFGILDRVVAKEALPAVLAIEVTVGVVAWCVLISIVIDCLCAYFLFTSCPLPALIAICAWFMWFTQWTSTTIGTIIFFVLMTLGSGAKPHFRMLTKFSRNLIIAIEHLIPELIAFTMVILDSPIQINSLHTQTTVETYAGTTVLDIVNFTTYARESLGANAVFAFDVRSTEELVDVDAVVEEFGDVLGPLVAGAAIFALKAALGEFRLVVFTVEANESFSAVAFFGQVVFTIDAPATIDTKPPRTNNIKI